MIKLFHGYEFQKIEPIDRYKMFYKYKMASQWDHALSRMYATSNKMRKNHPNPRICKDDELLELVKELEAKWTEYHEIIQSGHAAFHWSDDFPAYTRNREQTLVDKCCYYEGLIEDATYEIKRRPWLTME